MRRCYCGRMRLTKVFGVAVLALGGLACVTSEVTPTGAPVAALPEGCAVTVFPSTAPNYPYRDIASARSRCHFTMGRGACIEELKKEACAAGADTVYGFSEGVSGESTFIAATFARRTRASAKPPISAAAVATGEGCNPPCSPGFACRGTTCEPLCNPACEQGEVCTRKRTCEPAAN